jgi:sterol desaturase/sphingolipid hydroxylase (fatty acid hydroxylase superfamily)
MTHFETVLRLHGETLLYALFFGGVFGFGLLETIVAMRALGANRRGRWPTNWALTALNILLLGALPVSALVLADRAREFDIGLLNHRDWPLAAEVTLGVLAFSLQSWAVHLAMHKLPLLWRLHRVHHTDTHMDVSTTVRFHPLEFLLQLPVSAFVIMTLGAPPVAVILYELMDAAINVFSHANIRLPERLDRVLSRLIVTPHLHRVHHSTHQPETDSNFGATLPVWDMLFGTYRRKTPDALAEQRIGLDEMQDERAASLGWALSLPFRDIRTDQESPSADDHSRPADL